jgi:hypothetical protein
VAFVVRNATPSGERVDLASRAGRTITHHEDAIMASKRKSADVHKGPNADRKGMPGGHGGKGQSGTDQGKTDSAKKDKAGYGSSGAKGSGGTGSSQGSGGGSGGHHG